MALIKSVRGFTPVIGENCYLADNATIIGDVIMGHDCSIWFNTVLRGDVNSIRIGDRVNIQDGSVLHTLYEKSTVEIGNDVSIGHNVTLHGATVKDNALIGMALPYSTMQWSVKAPSLQPEPWYWPTLSSSPIPYGEAFRLNSSSMSTRNKAKN